MNLKIEFDTETRSLDQTADVVRWIAAMIEDDFTSGPIYGDNGPVGTWSLQ